MTALIQVRKFPILGEWLSPESVAVYVGISAYLIKKRGKKWLASHAHPYFAIRSGYIEDLVAESLVHTNPLDNVERVADLLISEIDQMRGPDQ